MKAMQIKGLPIPTFLQKKNLRFLGGFWWMIRGSNAALP